MKNNPRVSVIVPSYNHGKFIRQGILSVVNQTYNNIKLIVVDDGSSDDSAIIAEALSREHGFIFEGHKNKGVSKTLNDAIAKYAEGKYIVTLASDDLIAPDKIEKQVNFMEEHPQYGAVCARVKYINNDGVEFGESDRLTEDMVTFKHLFLESNCIISNSTMYRFDVWQDIQGYDNKLIIEDWDFWLRLSYKYPIAFVDDFVGFYRRHGNNVSLFKLLNGGLDVLNKWKDHRDYEHAINNYFFLYAKMYADVGNWPNKKESIKLFSRIKLSGYLKWGYLFEGSFYKTLLKLILKWKNAPPQWH